MEKRFRIPSLIISLVIGLIFIGTSFFNIYSNNKTDGFGSGTIKVSQCKEYDWAWKIYICVGDYNSSAGMIGIRDVSVRVTGQEYKAGDYIGDVYPASGSSIQNSRYFITGTERVSVYHNVPWLVLAGVGFLLPIVLGAYLVGLSSKNKFESRLKH